MYYIFKVFSEVLGEKYLHLANKINHMGEMRRTDVEGLEC